uniref:Uncharacterized protein n=1 Tax=Salix viminalis TaxID=40686 RepID=A0A6N2M2X6_SALVM
MTLIVSDQLEELHITWYEISTFLVSSCFNLVEIDLSNRVELNDLAAAAIAEAKNLEKLWLSRCKLLLIWDWVCAVAVEVEVDLLEMVSDLGLQLLALKCKEIRSLDLSYLQITEMSSIYLQLQHLEDLVLEGCLGIDDNASLLSNRVASHSRHLTCQTAIITVMWACRL